jgi:hypothetical protein
VLIHVSVRVVTVPRFASPRQLAGFPAALVSNGFRMSPEFENVATFVTSSNAIEYGEVFDWRTYMVTRGFAISPADCFSTQLV